MKPWMLALGGGALVLLLASRTTRAPGELSEEDLDALARMLITETSFALSAPEMAQIVWVAVNRSRKSGLSLRDTVYPPGRKPVWNRGPVYASRYQNAGTSSRYPAARTFVQQVLAGAIVPNRGYTTFSHPRGLPTPPCNAPKVAGSTASWGVRCMPPSLVGGDTVGTAMFA